MLKCKIKQPSLRQCGLYDYWDEGTILDPRNEPKSIKGLLMYDESRIANQGGGEGWGGSITQHRALEQPGSHVGIKHRTEYLPHTLPQNKCWRD